MPRGARPGERRGGRAKGTRNKSTIEKALLAERIAAEAKQTGRPLAKEQLDKLMAIFEGATAFFQPTLPHQIAAGQPTNPNGDWDKFERWALNFMNCAKELAKYQSPQYRAILVAPAPDPDQGERRRRFTLTVFEGGQQARTVANVTPISSRAG
jgi:hypothetical protein